MHHHTNSSRKWTTLLKKLSLSFSHHFKCSIWMFRMMTRLQSDIEVQFPNLWPPDVSKNQFIVSRTFSTSVLLFCWCPSIDHFLIWQLCSDKYCLLFDLFWFCVYLLTAKTTLANADIICILFGNKRSIPIYKKMLAQFTLSFMCMFSMLTKDFLQVDFVSFRFMPLICEYCNIHCSPQDIYDVHVLLDSRD